MTKENRTLIEELYEEFENAHESEMEELEERLYLLLEMEETEEWLHLLEEELEESL